MIVTVAVAVKEPVRPNCKKVLKLHHYIYKKIPRAKWSSSAFPNEKTVQSRVYGLPKAVASTIMQICATFDFLLYFLMGKQKQTVGSINS